MEHQKVIKLLEDTRNEPSTNEAFNFAKNPKYDEYQCGLASMVYKFFDKKTSGGAVKNEIM